MVLGPLRQAVAASTGGYPPGVETTPEQRREELISVYREMCDAHACPLEATRTKLVFGAGNANAGLMFVGEAPGANEDRLGLPFVGRAGKLLDEMLGEVGLERGDVFITNVLKCLRYNARVQLGDGSWERIGRLVRSRYDGDVMSVDAQGRLVPRRVSGWHATPLAGRRVVRLTYRSAKAAGARGSVGVHLTGDHPVLTERGFVPVEELGANDRIATGQGLSSLGFDVACGTLLGDGTIGSASSYLAFGHSDRQSAYAWFKADLLSELSARVDELQVAAVAGGPRLYPVVHVRTRAHRALRTLRADFCGDKKRVPRWLGSRLNERMLAIWFMDDGHLRIRPGRRPLAEVATLGFEHEDLQVLLGALRRLGLAATTSRGRIYFNADATRTLSTLIAPYVPSPMRYKLDPEVEASIPFEESRYAPGPPEVMYDAVDVEDVTHLKRRDATFFCIDVEETHNFVTAGGVVHNCRPPGNRDPLPGEIEICKPFLFRQIELIQPKVICTLGNFSTKLLSGQPTGITRVHGRPQSHTFGSQAVTLFPMFHPAAALRTPAVLELLREDFAKLPELLRDDEKEDPAAAAVEQMDLFG